MRIQVPASKVFLGKSFALFRSLNGKHYIVPAWIEVDESTTLEDIEIVEDRIRHQAVTRDIKGSKGNVYTVSIDENGRGNCTCSGFAFRRSCKHIEEVKNVNNAVSKS